MRVPKKYAGGDEKLLINFAWPKHLIAIYRLSRYIAATLPCIPYFHFFFFFKIVGALHDIVRIKNECDIVVIRVAANSG